MKHNKHTGSMNSAVPDAVPVHFEYSDPNATSVSVAGTFNHWHPDGRPLHPAGAGHWWRETALAPGTYEYCLVVDGRWMADPLALESVANPFGGRNSILRVTALPEAAQSAGTPNAKSASHGKRDRQAP